MSKESEPQKPEWFELVDGDAPSAQVTKVSKKLPAIAVLVTGAVIATGAFFASAEDKSHAEEPTAASTINQVDNSTPTPAATNATPSAGTPGLTGIDAQAPSIGARPHGEGDDQFGDDDDYRDHDGGDWGDRPAPDGDFEHGDRHEGGEHHERD